MPKAVEISFTSFALGISEWADIEKKLKKYYPETINPGVSISLSYQECRYVWKDRGKKYLDELERGKDYLTEVDYIIRIKNVYHHDDLIEEEIKSFLLSKIARVVGRPKIKIKVYEEGDEAKVEGLMITLSEKVFVPTES